MVCFARLEANDGWRDRAVIAWSRADEMYTAILNIAT
jgi:hypothetical protein